jgi:hypothetical protein
VSGAPFWITSVTGGGIGSGTVTYNVLPNDASSQVRSATLTIGDRPFTITQAGAPCTFSMMLNDGGAGMVTDGHTATISAAGGTYTLNVTTAPADCAWTPVSNSSWITLADGSPRVGDAVVTYSVAPLAHTALARSGKISLTVASGSLGVLSVTISQIH